MTAPTAYRRNATDVQAMRLEDWQEMAGAQEWLAAHGVRCVYSGIGRQGRLTIYGPGTRMVARLGDWLTLDVGSGEFAVEADDDGKPSGHTKVEA